MQHMLPEIPSLQVTGCGVLTALNEKRQDAFCQIWLAPREDMTRQEELCLRAQVRDPSLRRILLALEPDRSTGQIRLAFSATYLGFVERYTGYAGMDAQWVVLLNVCLDKVHRIWRDDQLVLCRHSETLSPGDAQLSVVA